ncbi:MAG: 3,4-dihydroxy-2-butanone-4-phosphate synthase [Gammaproteobacteria bacterium]|nr:3,4-dihydroxy-2-butanone-4-phosphate synthase [Gammaproteobacteria bacterium]
MNSTEDIIAAIRQGEMVIIMDDEDRENEGDLIMSASHVKSEDINFMARYGRGLICLTLTRERCQQLRLPLMVNENSATHSTNFTVSIEAASGVTTGISAADRAKTIQAAVAQDARPDHLVQPGHIFPLMAMPGGVLSRAGHTEAGCDLTRLAGLESAAVIVEILNEDGEMARRPDLERFASKHQLKIGTITDLIQYRLKHEKTIERVCDCNYPTEFGEFQLYAYQDSVDNRVHLALSYGDLDSDQPIPVRVHARHTLGDLLASTRSDHHGIHIQDAMRKIVSLGRGVLVILRQYDDNQSLVELIHHYQMEDHGVNFQPESHSENWRTTGTGAQILADLGVHQIIVLGPKKNYLGLSGYDLQIIDHMDYDETT